MEIKTIHMGDATWVVGEKVKTLLVYNDIPRKAGELVQAKFYDVTVDPAQYMMDVYLLVSEEVAEECNRYAYIDVASVAVEDVRYSTI
jgi:hypothetical protein